LANGWSQPERYIMLTRWCDIHTPEVRRYTIDWCDGEYGEFSGDIIQRYLDGLALDGQARALNSDRLHVLQKTKD